MEVIYNKYGALYLLLILLTATRPQTVFAELPDTLAIFDDKVITVEQFTTRFNNKKIQTGISDNLEIRNGYLANLINDELLISKAKNSGFDNTDEALNELKRIQLQELLNSFSVKHISPQVKVTDEELKTLFINMNTKLDVSHLYTSTLQDANNLYKMVKAGHSFNELALQSFDDPQLKNNGGSLGFITVDEMDPEFEKVAYSLKIGEISKPVKTVRGYSIIKLNGIKRNPLVTENEFLKVRNRLNALARKRQFETVIKTYSRDLAQNLQIKFDEQFIIDLFNSIKDKSNIVAIENSVTKSDLNKIVVTSKLGEWNLEMIVDEMKLTTPKLKQWIRTEENLKDFIAGLVTRKYIWMQALNEKLDTASSYKTNVQFGFDTYLLEKMEENLKSQIKISSEQVKKYYNKNKQYFYLEPEVRLSSILLDSEKISDTIKTRLENGDAFEKLASKYSLQTQTALFGGDMGYFKKNELDQLGETLFYLKIGEWEGPFLDEGKYLFIQCTDIRNGEYKTVEESSEEITQSLIAQNWFTVREEYVQELKKELHVKSFPEKLNKIKLN